MKIRTILPCLTGLFVALPAFAQEAAPADDATAPAAPAAEPAPAAEAPAAPAAATAEGQVQAPTQEGGVATANAETTTAAPAPKKATLAATPSRSGPESTESSAGEWKFDYKGYIRAPMRIGLGKRDNPRDDESGTTFHRPLIPDDQFLSWQSSPHNKSEWAELFFTVGNSWAKATAGIQSYNFTDAAWNDPATQLGIGTGWVTLTPDLGYENFRLAWQVGAFSDKYGQAGKYDAGEYDTYLFGRTHQIGETLHLEFDLNEAWTLWGEHGIGTKRPDPNPYNNARFTMLHHVHLGLNQGRDMQFSAHYMHSWAQEEPREGGGMTNGSIVNIGDGKLWTTGVDARFDLGAFGYFYGGYSHIGAKNALVVSRAIEVMHASGGGEFGLGVVANYFGTPCTESNAGQTNTCSMGTGNVDSVLGQYEFSLTNFLQQSEGGGKFWGDGEDLKITLYGMFQKVGSDFRPPGAAAATAPTDGITKLKYGADLQWAALPWLTAALRADRLQPNSEVPEQSFSIISPRLVFRSTYNSHEALTIQYSRYLYNERTCTDPARAAACVQPPSSPVPPDGFGADPQNNDGDRAEPITNGAAAVARPDVNVIKVEATFWW